MPPRHKPDASERERARQALALRTQGMSYAEIARRLNYRGEAGPRKAIDRLLSRREHEAAAHLRVVEGQRLDDAQAAIWPKVLGGDLGAVREFVRISERRSKLLGLDSPQRVEVEGISASEFAEMAAEMLRVTGPAPLIEAALPALERAEREAWITATEHTSDDEYDDSDPWCNFGPQSGYARPLCDTAHSAPGAPPPAHGDRPPISYPECENDDRGDDTDEQGAGDAAEPEVVNAEIVGEVILPPSQRRVPASEVLDENGVPLSRTGYARRLGGYDPLAHWRP